MDRQRGRTGALAVWALVVVLSGSGVCLGGNKTYMGVPQTGCGWYRHPRPYDTGSCLYGYQDYVYGRGPLIDLGSGTLDPGFRGFGVFGSPGYGQGCARILGWILIADSSGWAISGCIAE